MSIDLIKNKDALVAAWTSVVDDKSPVNWAVFGYEGQTNTLKVVGSGSGGLEEMIEELNSGHIMYSFCRVIDTKTSLPKCVLINWQGELAPIVRKGTCANHIRDIERLLKGAHITINARSEEDVEVELIMEKLARATGSAYKFQAPRSKDIGNSVPVGTTYKRVIPEQEINASERDEFWQKEEMEEKARVEQEKCRREEERRRVEQETRVREEKQSKIRGLEEIKQQQQRQPTVDVNIQKSDQRVQELKNLRNQQMQNKTPDDNDESPSRSDELRRQRSNEAQQLIAQRTINARAVFEQNSSAGQMKTTYSSSPKLVSKEQPSLDKNLAIDEAHTTNTTNQQKPNENVIDIEKEDSIQQQILPDSGSTTSLKTDQSTIPEEKKTTDQDQTASSQEMTNVENELYNQLSGENYLYFDPTNEGMKARALYDYQAADDTEITFDPGDIITHIDAIDEGWWQGLAPDGTYGLFPANYVEVIEYTQT